MPIHQRWAPEHSTLFVRFEPPLSADAFLRWAEALSHDDSLPPGRQELIDLSAVEGTDIQGDSLRELADTFRGRGESRIALVVSRDLVFGLGRMYQAYRGEDAVNLEVFREDREARLWLDLPEDAEGA